MNLSRTPLGEDLSLDQRLNLAQKGDDLMRRALFGDAGEADNVGEEDRRLRLALRAERRIPVGERLDHFGGKIAREIGRPALLRGLAHREAQRSRHRHRKQDGGDEEDRQPLELHPEIEVMRISGVGERPYRCVVGASRLLEGDGLAPGQPDETDAPERDATEPAPDQQRGAQRDRQACEDHVEVIETIEAEEEDVRQTLPRAGGGNDQREGQQREIEGGERVGAPGALPTRAADRVIRPACDGEA